MAYDQRRTLLLGLGVLQGNTDSIRIVAVNLLHVPPPRFVFGCHILGGYLATHRGELHLIAIVEHDKIIQSERAGYTACALGYLFLHAAIGDKRIDSRIVHLAKTCVHELSRDSCANCKRVALAERT